MAANHDFEVNGSGRRVTRVGRQPDSSEESLQWEDFGRWLLGQREERGLRRREAAKRAKVSEAQWRDLETGRKQAIGGIKLLPNPSPDVLERVASALELPVEDLLARAGRPTRRREARAAGVAEVGDLVGLEAKLARLGERDRRLVEVLVEGMLAGDAPA